MTESQRMLIDMEGDALSRRDDPETSREAAEGVSVADDELLALNLLLTRDGSTAGELEAAYKLQCETSGQKYREGKIRKRLAGLRAKGKLRNGDSRPCAAMGSKQMTWWRA